MGPFLIEVVTINVNSSYHSSSECSPFRFVFQIKTSGLVVRRRLQRLIVKQGEQDNEQVRCHFLYAI